jgi:hypothetical protein
MNTTPPVSSADVWLALAASRACAAVHCAQKRPVLPAMDMCGIPLVGDSKAKAKGWKPYYNQRPRVLRMPENEKLRAAGWDQDGGVEILFLIAALAVAIRPNPSLDTAYLLRIDALDQPGRTSGGKPSLPSLPSCDSTSLGDLGRRGHSAGSVSVPSSFWPSSQLLWFARMCFCVRIRLCFCERFCLLLPHAGPRAAVSTLGGTLKLALAFTSFHLPPSLHSASRARP